ncbi:chemotaxis protein CheD [bacterium AH-315-I18]|nr:chemotaxis protein CheD [Phycisphaeraceae bacterium]MBN4061188.1 chemotaxis protein CheD [bacterium AH-315-I18]
MTSKVITIADMHVTSDITELLITYSLGSCLGVVAYDPVARVGGMIHCLLPMSKSNPEKARQNPATYTDTGMAALFNLLFEHGARKENLQIKVAGGAAPMDMGGQFRIGERNFAVLRKFLWKNNLLLSGQDVGGKKPRTMSLDMATGRTTIKSKGIDTEL